MQGNNSHQAEGNYQAIIELMQAYDCSYEEAQRHFQLLRMSKQTKPSLNHYSQRGSQRFNESQFIDNYEVLDTVTVIPFTRKEHRALKLFFSGNMNHFKIKPEPSFCQKVSTKMKDLRRKVKCLKYLNPKRVWRAINRKRSPSHYDRLTNNDSSQTQNVKGSHQRWFQIDIDWMDELAQNSIELTNYLHSHKSLLRSVTSINRQGVRSSLPDSMNLPPSLQPYLFIREQAAQSIATNVKLSAQKVFKIICLDNHKFNLLHREVEQEDAKIIFSLAFINIFEEVQILKTYTKAGDLDVESAEKIFRHFLIKNRLFKSMVDREINEMAFTFEQPDEYQSQDEEDERTKKESQTHQSIIKEQNTLYQSMLSSYVSKSAEKQKIQQTAQQYQKRREAVKLTIRQEPTASSQTIHIMFRTPTGQTLARNFHKQDTIQYVKNWVFCEDQIQFENTTSSFDLYHGYPPTLVQSKPNEALWSIFGEEESKLRLIIKQN